ncbi:Ldh family oxidoreductase [Saliphagus infecundisoli]|uniref:Ldh family oxidoreductase n=1 Tax=Saliphagus infecundisoli TaxID=1849069 RepID=A0ABD5QKL9_9EURY|nr:Ldh family oxidoreductase [Saliphagus infecundisoli]
MPTVDADALTEFARESIGSLGAPERTARAVADSLVDADLAGHGSHGVVRLDYYAGIVADGAVDPEAEPTHRSAGPFDQLVGGAAFGQLTGERAVSLLVEGARAEGVAIVGIRDSGHLGRIGEWAERVASEGLLFASWVNLQGGSQRVAPAGSADRRLGTNPLTFAVPTFGALPFDLVFDAATSQVAHGKIIERDGSGEELPETWTTTPSGDPVTRAAEFEDGTGALLPLGGRETGYKGFGLSTMAELFAGIVGDGPVASEERQEWTGNGGAFLAIDPAHFTTAEAVADRVEGLAAHLRSAEPIGDEEVLLPGEPEHRTTNRRREEGIPIEPTVVDGLRELAAEQGVESALPPGLE